MTHQRDIFKVVFKSCCIGLTFVDCQVHTSILPSWLKFLKAELLQVGNFFLIHLFARYILLLKELEIEETKII